MAVKEEAAPVGMSQQSGPSRPLPASRLTSSGPSSRASPALAGSPPPVPTSNADADSLFARAQAMGIRLTREDYERTRAGVTAFLKADRIPSSSSSSSSAIASPASGAPPPQPSAAKSASTSSATSRSQRLHASPTDTAPPHTANSPPLPSSSSTDSQHTSLPTRNHHAVTRPGGPLSFFTRVVTPEPAHPPKPRPRLQDVGNAEERKRRKLRRARLRDKMASMSVSEPEFTPQMSFASPRTSTSTIPAPSAHEPARVGLGLSSTGTSPATLASSSPCDPSSSSSSSMAIRSRTVSASAIPSTSSSLQHVTSSTPDRASTSATKKISPALQRLTRRAWVSPNGKLSLVPASSFSDTGSSSLRVFPVMAYDGDGSPSKKTYFSSVGDDSGVVIMDDEDETDLLDDGYEGANRAGWGTRARTESAGSTGQSTQQLSTSAPAQGSGIAEGMAKLGLLDKVMADKRSPRRRRQEAKLRDRLQRHSRTLTEAEKTALEVAAANASVPETKVGRASAASDTQEEAAQLMPAPSHDDTARRRRATHTRQRSVSAYKNVRWANPVPSPVHERMTTKEHYEYSHHGILPGYFGQSLNDVNFDDPDMDLNGPPSSTSMPWLFGAHGLDSTPSRLPGSPTGGSGSADSLNVDFSTPLDADASGDDSRGGYSMFNARRGLLFGPSSPLTSPARVPVQRFNPHSSDPSLSQSPQRGPGGVFMNAGSPTRLTVTNRKRHRSNASISGTRETFGLPLGRTPTLAPSPLKPGRTVEGTTAAMRFDTISPAAIFGIGADDALAGRAQMNVGSAGAVDGAHTQPLPEPTKRWSELPGFDDDEPGMIGSQGDKNVNESPARVRAKSTIAQQRLKAATAANAAAASLGDSSGIARVSGQGTMDWGVLSQLTGATLEMAFSANMGMLQPALSAGGLVSSNGQADAAGAIHGAPAQQPIQPTAPAPAPTKKRPAPMTSAAVQANPNAVYWDQPDGSRWVKLVSAETQAAIDAGDLAEPPLRYYVLPPGWGSSKQKPAPMSYAGLIGQAILSSSDGRLSLNEIYNWISTVHPYFERYDRGWQNSIRHNLSLNKSLIKAPREVEIPGKGGWWIVQPGDEGRFQNGLFKPGAAGAGGDSPEADDANADDAEADASDADSPGAEGAGDGSSKKKKKPRKKPQKPRARANRQRKPTPKESTPALPTQAQPEITSAPRQARKRQTTFEPDSAASSPGRDAGSHQVRGKGGSTLKKPKLDAEQENGNRREGGTAARGPLNSLTNKPLAAQHQQHQHQYVASFAPADTPMRPGRPYVMSSGYGPSSNGMPHLTDASSPATSPMPMSDALMPPPSVGPSFVKRKGPQQYGSNEAFFNMPNGLPMSSELQQSSATTSVDLNMTPAHANFFHGGPMYSSQPSPLADRIRSLGGGNMTVSPLRRQTLPVSTGGASGKLTSLSPVSSVRGSSLAGAMNMRLGGNVGSRGQKVEEGSGNGGSGNLFNTSMAPNPFAAAASTSRPSPVQAQGAFVQSHPFAQATSYSPMRGSPLRLSTGNTKAFGAVAGSSPQRLGGMTSNGAGSALSPAGADLQNALAGAGLGSMGPSIGGLGFGFTSTNITPARITPNSRKNGGMIGPSPSPTVRRLQQQGGGWLEDPFDYQGALQHELENMGATMNGLLGQGNVQGHGQGSAQGGSADQHAGGPYNPSPMKYGGGGMAMGGAGIGGAWFGGGIGNYAGLGNATHHDNVSAVRDSVRRGGEGGESGGM